VVLDPPPITPSVLVVKADATVPQIVAGFLARVPPA
jgi:hypothetical protein